MYEAICIVLTALIAGILNGYFATMLSSALFAQLTELPMELSIPVTQIILICTVISLATFFAVHYPARNMHRHSISSVLRGISK